MPIPAELKPVSKLRVIELVKKTGLDVSDWADYERGSSNPGANPKYCYEWAFIDHDKLVVCNLWYENMLQRDREIEQHLFLQSRDSNATRRARQSRMKANLIEAYDKCLPVRVIVLDGVMSEQAPNKKASVRARKLDPVPWAVVSADRASGKIILRRGASPVSFVDQFSLEIPPESEAPTRIATVSIRDRNPQVRHHALQRANGNCEYCGNPGFRLPDGRIYLETHHIVPLAENGPDSVNNVVALCPNHHREAHYGRDSVAIRKTLQQRLKLQTANNALQPTGEAGG